jgi:hypothetical protein
MLNVRDYLTADQEQDAITRALRDPDVRLLVIALGLLFAAPEFTAHYDRGKLEAGGTDDRR